MSTGSATSTPRRPAAGRRADGRLFGDLADLRALQGSVAHQPLLTKNESEDRLAERLGVVATAGTHLRNCDRGVRTDRPVLAVDELVAGLRRLQQNHLAV